MCDKMKQKGGILLNTSNDEVVGFTSVFVSMKKTVTDIFDKELVYKLFQPLKSVISFTTSGSHERNSTKGPWREHNKLFVVSFRSSLEQI